MEAQRARLWKGNELANLERARHEALKRADCLEYFLACNALGVEPEWRDLYEQGRVLAQVREARADSKTARAELYANFAREAEQLGISLTLDKQTHEKVRLLEKYFPKRFGVRGVQPLNALESCAIGKIFLNLLNYAQKRATRNRKISRAKHHLLER
ncbi:hypothetical protein D6817_01195 [Candidatus Pacearchaeota archaeon]|nr:MAG: hypothetical protein D6817_01195 [Candidatus Pacearchaeota archaeon]